MSKSNNQWLEQGKSLPMNVILYQLYSIGTLQMDFKKPFENTHGKFCQSNKLLLRRRAAATAPKVQHNDVELFHYK